jgi:hypothetical protein
MEKSVTGGGNRVKTAMNKGSIAPQKYFFV